jgi:uncharacterized repeat protein (TIGR01451 family)
VRRLAVVLVVLVVLPAVPAAAAERAFSQRFNAKTNGQIAVIGNANMSCQTAVTNCATARALSPSNTASTPSYANDFFTMTFVDVDDDATTTNSSTATLSLPAGAEVLFAGLYWAGRPATAGAKSVQIKPPSGMYVPASDSAPDSVTSPKPAYQAFADVTSTVQAGGGGVYSVANVESLQETDSFAAWALVVAYRDPAQTQARDLSVFDGYRTLDGVTAATIPVSGFQTPPTGPVKTDLGFVGWEGDRTVTPDSASINGTVLGDANNPQTNFFNSSTSDHGTEVTASRDPSYSNTFGVDADALTVPAGVIGNGATTASLKLEGGERYYSGALAFSTDLYAPEIHQTTTVSDVNGGDLLEGDVLHYTITGVNQGQDGAKEIGVHTPIPAHTSYVAGSAQTSSGTVGLAAGAVDASPADLAVNGPYTVQFDAKVDPAVADGTTISATSDTTYKGVTLTTTLTTQSSAATASTVKAPDLAVAITHAPAGTIGAGSDVSYSLKATNVGRRATAGAATLAATLPAGLTLVSASGPGWSCTGSSCTHAAPIAAGADSAITVVAHVADAASGPLDTGASVAQPEDGNPTNDGATDSITVERHADLGVDVTASRPAAAPGQTVTFTLAVTNAGPTSASGVSVTDAIPAGLTYVSDDGGCVTGATLTCAVGALAAGGSATVHVVTTVDAQPLGTVLTDTASVSGTPSDLNDANDTDSAAVTVHSADLGVSIDFDPVAPAAGQPLAVRLDAVDLGPEDATGVVLSATVPTTLTGVAAPAGCTLTGGTLSCAVGALAKDAHAVVTLHGTVAEGAGAVAATAGVGGDQPDPVSGNDTASKTATIASGTATPTPTATTDPTATATATRTPTPTATTSAVTPTATATAVVTPTPTASPDQFEVLGESELFLSCAKLRIALIDVLKKGHRVRITGVATRHVFAGKTVDVLLDGRKVGTAKVDAAGKIATTVRAPRRRALPLARYQLRSGHDVSRQIKLDRRMLVDSIKRVGKRVVIKGRITRPIARHPAKIVFKRATSCTNYRPVGTARPNRHTGRFVARLPIPPKAKAAIYRGQTKVANHRGGKATGRTFTLSRSVTLR